MVATKAALAKVAALQAKEASLAITKTKQSSPKAVAQVKTAPIVTLKTAPPVKSPTVRPIKKSIVTPVAKVASVSSISAARSSISPLGSSLLIVTACL